MDWETEPWVKLYTRETATMAMLPWEARALLRELLTKCGADGVVHPGRHGARGLAALVRIPEDVVRPALDDLVAEDVVQVVGDCESILVTNFSEAQKARTSDKERKRRSREAKAAEAKKRAASQQVTASHSRSQQVTAGHTSSRIEENRRERIDGAEAPARAHTREAPPPLPPADLSSVASGLGQVPAEPEAWGHRKAGGIYARHFERATGQPCMNPWGAHRELEQLAHFAQARAKHDGGKPEQVLDTLFRWYFAQEWAAKMGFNLRRLVQNLDADWLKAAGIIVKSREDERGQLQRKAEAMELAIADCARSGRDPGKTPQQLEALTARLRALDG